MTLQSPAVVTHWIDGAERQAHSDRTAPVYDPALGVETKRVALADRADIDAETEDFDALVTEMACASGQSSADRIVTPRIVVEADAITITFGVTPLEGSQDCQGNPASEVRVELPEPLGDRELRDGGVYPPTTFYP